MKRINDFFAPSAKKRLVDGKCIMYLRIMINPRCAALERKHLCRCTTNHKSTDQSARISRDIGFVHSLRLESVLESTKKRTTAN